MESKVKESDITLTNDEATWDLVYHGPIGGTYMGRFKFRCFLTPMHALEADRDFRELLGPNAQFAITNSENIAYSLSQLRQRVIEAPPFWYENTGRFGGGGVKDLGILDIVLDAAVSAEVKYRQELKKRHEDAIARVNKEIERRQKEEEINKEIDEN